MKNRFNFVLILCLFIMGLFSVAFVNAQETCTISKPVFNTENYQTAEGKAFGQQLYDAYWDCLENTLSKDPEYYYPGSGIDTAKCPEVQSLSRSATDSLVSCQTACTYESDYAGCANSRCAIDLDKNKGCSSYYDTPNDPCPYYASQTNFHQWQEECKAAETTGTSKTSESTETNTAEEQTGGITEIKRPTLVGTIKFESNFVPLELSPTQMIYLKNLNAGSQTEMLKLLQRWAYEKQPDLKSLVAAKLNNSPIAQKLKQEMESEAQFKTMTAEEVRMFKALALMQKKLTESIKQKLDSIMSLLNQ